jgi:hypothetical protein
LRAASSGSSELDWVMLERSASAQARAAAVTAAASSPAPAPPRYGVGTLIEGNYRGAGAWYAGRVVATHAVHAGTSSVL